MEKEDNENSFESGHSADEELPVAVVLEAAQNGKAGRYWEWPAGTKFYCKDANGGCSEVGFYQYSFEYADGEKHREFFRVHRPQNASVELVVGMCSVRSAQFGEFQSKYKLLKPDVAMVPVTVDGYDVKVGGCYRYDFPGRSARERCVFVKCLNYAFGVAVCVQTVDEFGQGHGCPLSERIMIVHSSRLRKRSY